MRSYRVSGRYDQFSRRDTWEYKNREARSYGVSHYQYKINGYCEGEIDNESYKVGKAY